MREDMKNKERILEAGRGMYMDLKRTYVPIGVVVALVGVYWFMMKEMDKMKTDLRDEMRSLIAESRSEITPTDAEVFLSKEAGRYLRENQEEIKRDVRELKERQEMLLQLVLEIKSELKYAASIERKRGSVRENEAKQDRLHPTEGWEEKPGSFDF